MKETYRKSSGLLELVVVGLIIAVLFVIAVPAILERISTSKKNAYIDIVKMYVDAARNASITEGFDFPSDKNHATAISFSELKDLLEKGGATSAYGNEWKVANSYVVIVNEGESEDPRYVYYVAAFDGKYAIGEVTDGSGSVARIVNADELGNGNVVRVSSGLALPSKGANNMDAGSPATDEASFIELASGDGTITVDEVYDGN